MNEELTYVTDMPNCAKCDHWQYQYLIEKDRAEAAESRCRKFQFEIREVLHKKSEMRIIDGEPTYWVRLGDIVDAMERVEK